MDLNSVVSRIERELAGTFPALKIGLTHAAETLLASGPEIEDDLIAVLYHLVRESSVRSIQIATGIRPRQAGTGADATDYSTLSFTLKLEGTSVADQVCAAERHTADLQTLKRAVEEYGGTVELEATGLSRLRLTISLPSCDELSQADDMPRSSGETVLLVEDEDFVRGVTREVLEMVHYRVLEACNGEVALQVFQDNGSKVELLLTDVVMPGMNGRDLAERLKALAPDLKVLYMSGYTENAVLRHGLEKDCAAYLQKPFALEALITKVHEVLHAATTPPAPVEPWTSGSQAETGGI